MLIPCIRSGVIATLLATLLLSLTNSLSADIAGWNAELNSGGNPKVAFQNTSDPGWSIKDITIDFTTANLSTIMLDKNGSPAVASLPIGSYGSFNTTVTNPLLITFSTLNPSNNVSDIKTYIGNGNLMTFSFQQGTFGPGEGWGFNVDWDNSPTDDTAPVRKNLSGAQIHVTFWEKNSPTVSFTYSQSNANGVSFPAQAFANVVPEPGAGLALAALATIIGATSGRSRRSRR